MNAQLLVDELQRQYEDKHQELLRMEERRRETGMINNLTYDRLISDTNLAGTVAARARDTLAKMSK